MKKFICTAAAVLSAAVFVSCASSDVKGGTADGKSGALLSESTAEKPEQKKMYKGKGLLRALSLPRPTHHTFFSSGTERMLSAPVR